MAEDFYEPPRDEMSQGDILELLPSVRIDFPLQLLEPRSDGLFSAYPAELHGHDGVARQGIAWCRVTKAILLSHDCEIDKPNAKYWVISPVVPISTIPGSAHLHIRKNKILHLVHLSEYRDILEESVIVLDQTTTLDPTFVKASRRIVSLSDLGRRALYAQNIRWLTRWQLSELQCPNCGFGFNAADAMKVRS